MRGAAGARGWDNLEGGREHRMGEELGTDLWGKVLEPPVRSFRVYSKGSSPKFGDVPAGGDTRQGSVGNQTGEVRIEANSASCDVMRGGAGERQCVFRPDFA